MKQIVLTHGIDRPWERVIQILQGIYQRVWVAFNNDLFNSSRRARAHNKSLLIWLSSYRTTASKLNLTQPEGGGKQLPCSLSALRDSFQALVCSSLGKIYPSNQPTNSPVYESLMRKVMKFAWAKGWKKRRQKLANHRGQCSNIFF